MYMQGNSLVRQQGRLMEINAKFTSTFVSEAFGRLGVLWSASRAAIIPVLVIAALWTVSASIAKASCSISDTPRFGAATLGSELLGAQQTADLNQSSEPASRHGQRLSIVGLWDVTFYSDGQAFDEGFDQWHSDGLELLNDNGPPEPPNGSGSICVGVYKKTGPATYKLRHPFWTFDGNGDLTGSAVLLEWIALDKSGNSYRGSLTMLFYDLGGNLIGRRDGTLKASRITPD